MKPTLIVCAVEFSAEGRAVLAMALSLARWYEAELHVTHLGSRVRPQNTSATARSVDHELRARLDDFTAAVNVEGTKMRAVILQGDAVSALVDYTRSVPGQLTVVAQHGRRGSPYWAAGTFAKEVARGVGCPTITVPSRLAPKAAAAAPFQNIVCGINFSESSALALGHALFLAQQSRGRLTLVHVLGCVPPTVHDLRTKLTALVPPDGRNSCDIDIDIVPGTSRDAILVTAAARDADLIVIGQPRAISRRVKMASTAGAVLRRAQCPVLTIPARPSIGDVASVSTGIPAAKHEPISSPAYEPTVGSAGVPFNGRTISDRLQRSNWADRWQEMIHTMLRQRCPTPRVS
jgi:nucleotide-binding universal stress UspA family protein